MIPIKQKTCKATSKAKGFKTCGEEIILKKYGMCSDCYRKWLLNTDEGNKELDKYTLRAKTVVVKKKKKEIRQKKELIKNRSAYEKELQQIINTIVRLIDYDKHCISCIHGKTEPFTRQAHASHFWSVGSNAQLRFNLHNIHKSCSICNSWKHGNLIQYKSGIIERYDEAYMDLINNLPKKYISIKLDKESLKEAITAAKKIKKEIESGKDYCREEINKILGIYQN